MKSTKPQITVVGSSNIDFIFTVERIPAVGETVVGGAFRQAYGGKGANQAVAAARLGGMVTFVGSVGDDEYGRQMRRNFEADGIDAQYLSVAFGCETGAAGILCDACGNNSIAVASGANLAVTAEQIDQASSAIAGADIVVLQMEITPAANRRVIEIAREANVPVILNFAPARLGEITIDGRIAGLIVNETEAAALAGLPCDTAEEGAVAASALLALGCGFVVVTLGKAGLVIADAGGIDTIPAHVVTAVDATAAGDVFCGCVAVELATGAPLRAACIVANAAAALSVTRSGAQPSIPTRDEVMAFIRRR